MNWLRNPAHARWLEQESDALLTFGAASYVDEGFGYLDTFGAVLPAEGSHLWITSRMIHSFALATLLGRPGASVMVDHGIAALNSSFHDDINGGWYAQVGPGGPIDTTKAAYAHAFVILAASSAAVAGRPGAKELLEEALTTSLRRFWSEEDGMVVEAWNADFSELDDYRGVNANMHTVEAYLAAADVTGDDSWLERATRITERVVDGFARSNEWRIPEHFDSQWTPLLEYNMDTPADQFRPAGATIGHWLEWARLTLHVRQAWIARGGAGKDWMMEGAKQLFALAVKEGWGVDGADGFVYTVDFNGAPLVRERMHWVVAEALGAAASLYRATGEEDYAAWYQLWWDYASLNMIDEENGSWFHELSAQNGPSATVWAGKPDIYHALQATLIPRLPLAPVLAPALAQGMLDS